MAKWADYGIFRVKYNKDHTAIVEVEVKPHHGEQFGALQKMSRATVVQAIESRRSFVTVNQRDGKYVKGEAVHVVTIDRVKYIRTNNNSEKKDNLGELPEYE